MPIAPDSEATELLAILAELGSEARTDLLAVARGLAERAKA
jgi:hypothetical protein